MPLYPPRDGQQQAVPDDRTIRGIHGPELVDVDVDHRRPDLGLMTGPLHGNRETVFQKLPVGKAGKRALDGIVHQALLRPLRIRHVAQQPDALHGAPVLTGNGGRLDLVPAVGVVRVSQAEHTAHLSVVALLVGDERQPEPLPVGRMNVPAEILDLRVEFTRVKPEGRLHGAGYLDFVAPGAPFPHARPGRLHRNRPQLKLRRRRAIDGLERPEGELRDGKTDQQNDQHETGDEPRNDHVARQLAGQRHPGTEAPDDQEKPCRYEGERPVLPPQSQEHRDHHSHAGKRAERKPSEGRC